MAGMKWSLLWILMVLPLAGEESVPVAKAMEQAAQRLMQSVDEAQRKAMCLPMADASREDYRYTPRDRSGLLIKGLPEKSRAAVIDLLKSALSEKGMLKTQQIMMQEGVLAVMEKRPEFRDPEKYYVSVFGKPGDEAGWGWKFEGHHVSLNYTLHGGQVVAVTPSFFGSNPAEVRQGEHQGLRVLAAEEDQARALAVQLTVAGKPVRFSEKAPEEILTREESRVSPLETIGGVTHDQMDKDQQAALLQLIETYLDRHRPELAQADLKAIRDAGLGKVLFAWAGSLEKGGAWYYRIQGPTFLMEAANTQNQANHTHTVWREFKGDFGRDVLGEHFRKHAH